MTIENKSHTELNVRNRVDYILELNYGYLKRKLNLQPVLGDKDFELVCDTTHGPVVYMPIGEKYKIGLNIDGDFPLQIIYQVSHELCHLFVDPRFNGTLIEIVCQKTAIDCVEELGKVFFPNSNGVDDYIAGIKSKAEKTFGEKSKSGLWIKNEYLSRETNNIKYDREFNNLVAFRLKDILDKTDKFSLIPTLRNHLQTDAKKEGEMINENTKIDLNQLRHKNVEIAEKLIDLLKK